MNTEPTVLRNINWVEYGNTSLHPFAVILLLLMAVWLLHNDSEQFLIPFLIVGAFLTHMQRLVLGSLDFSMIRLIVIAGGVRAIVRKDYTSFEWKATDVRIILYVISVTIVFVALRRNGAAFVNRLGFAFETLSVYFLIRMYIRSEHQIISFIRALSIVFAFVAIFMTIEQLTHRNAFSVFGGVPQITPMREGRLRAQGAFSHPIMAGTFGAVFIPLFWGLWSTGDMIDRRRAIIGIISGIIITWASSSSGPILSLMSGLFALSLWKFRNNLKFFKRSFLLLLVTLHIVMDAPVWHLLARVDIVGGSTGWHRYALIDQAIRRFPEWMLLGVRTTGHWGWGLNDVTNMFIRQAVDGGLLTLLFFIGMIRSSFASVGEASKIAVEEPVHQRMYWSWGSVLFAHCVSFFGVSYFGQMNFFWVFTLAIIASLPQIAKTKEEDSRNFAVELTLNPSESSEPTMGYR